MFVVQQHYVSPIGQQWINQLGASDEVDRAQAQGTRQLDHGTTNRRIRGVLQHPLSSF
jgi:hypothetical protein